MTKCICDFPEDCAGIGVLYCNGCGGDQCICGPCFGHGEMDCPGCDGCADDFSPVERSGDGGES